MHLRAHICLDGEYFKLPCNSMLQFLALLMFTLFPSPQIEVL